MSDERPIEVQNFFDEIKHYIMDIVPDTISGYLIVFLISGLLLKTNSIDFLVDIAKTAVYMFCLQLCYYLAKAMRFLINDGLSRITSGKRTEEETQ